jgi:hypothetical protein
MTRRRWALVVTVSLACLGLAAQASAALYVGNSHGTRITIRTKGDKVVEAEFKTRLYCREDPGHKRFRRPEAVGFANNANPLRIDRHGIFRQIERPGVSGESFETDSAVIAHVSPNLVKGRFEYSYIVSEETWEVCQTNRPPYRSAEQKFSAHRVR